MVNVGKYSSPIEYLVKAFKKPNTREVKTFPAAKANCENIDYNCLPSF